jgi:hypothetical protein
VATISYRTTESTPKVWQKCDINVTKNCGTSFCKRKPCYNEMPLKLLRIYFGNLQRLKQIQGNWGILYLDSWVIKKTCYKLDSCHCVQHITVVIV